MAKGIIAIFSFLFLLTTTSSVFACDNLPCKTALKITTHKYANSAKRKVFASKTTKVKHRGNNKRLKIATVNVRRTYAINKARKQIANTGIGRNSNYRRKQIAAVNERRAHAINRARRDFALYHHIHRLASAANQRKAKTK